MQPFPLNINKKKVFFGLGVFFILVLFYATAPPLGYPSGTTVNVRDGAGLFHLAEELRQDGVIRSPFWFRFIVLTLGGERAMKAGDYYFAHPENTLKVAWRVLHGDYQVETIRLTIPEGFTVKKIAELFGERFVNFDKRVFEKEAKEGFLFPDTYFIPATATAESVLKLFKDNFDRKLQPLLSSVEASGRSLEEVVTMASILEGEARGREEMEIIAGILWRRIEIGMPLQVDTTFLYVNGKNTFTLTQADLKIDSPYNTYLYRGLPPTPISNPGLTAIRAALNPQPTPYLYFLTGRDGLMYYSRTHDEHVQKKTRYLR